MSYLVSGRPLLPHEMLFSKYMAEDEQYVLGSDLLNAINGFSHDQEVAFQRCVQDLMAWNKSARQFCDEARKMAEEAEKAVCKKSVKQFCDEAKQMDEEAQKAYAEYENEDEVFLDMWVEERMKKPSHKWSLNRRFSRKNY